MKVFRLIYVLTLALISACNSNTKQKENEKIQSSKNIPKVVTADIEAGIKANIAFQLLYNSGFWQHFHNNIFLIPIRFSMVLAWANMFRLHGSSTIAKNIIFSLILN